MLTIKENICQDYHAQLNATKKRRVSAYEDGFRASHFKDGGQKKVMILAMCGTQEKYVNVVQILALLDIECFDFGLAVDLKMLLILCGKQAASSKFCCPFCDDSSSWLDVDSRRLTLGDLYQDYEKFQGIRVAAKSEQAALKKAMTCHNVVNRPLLKGPMRS